MHYRQTILVPLLAAAVTLAGVACACAVPAMAAGEAPASQHAHHGGGDDVANMGCDHADCGDCMADGAVSKHEGLRDHGPQLPNMPLDTDGQGETGSSIGFPAGFAATPPPLRGVSYHPPIPRLPLAADTPVRRFDTLLI